MAARLVVCSLAALVVLQTPALGNLLGPETGMQPGSFKQPSRRFNGRPPGPLHVEHGQLHVDPRPSRVGQHLAQRLFHLPVAGRLRVLTDITALKSPALLAHALGVAKTVEHIVVAGLLAGALDPNAPAYGSAGRPDGRSLEGLRYVNRLAELQLEGRHPHLDEGDRLQLGSAQGKHAVQALLHTFAPVLGREAVDVIRRVARGTEWAGMLHDIGKLFEPPDASSLDPSDPISDSDYAKTGHHTVLGSRLLRWVLPDGNLSFADLIHTDVPLARRGHLLLATLAPLFAEKHHNKRPDASETTSPLEGYLQQVLKLADVRSALNRVASRTPDGSQREGPLNSTEALAELRNSANQVGPTALEVLDLPGVVDNVDRIMADPGGHEARLDGLGQPAAGHVPPGFLDVVLGGDFTAQGQLNALPGHHLVAAPALAARGGVGL